MSSRPSVFISYASQDREPARAIRDALLAAGIEAWYDENELGGGDVWDQKIRRQIRECVYFMPIISANTEARVEGYFRREWRLAAERTLDMADDVPFLIPVAIDGTLQEHARVPEKFLASQWMKLPGGQPTPIFNAWCARITSSEPPQLPRSARATAFAPPPQNGKKAAGTELPAFPPFPHQVPGQSIKFIADIAAWLVHTALAAYRHFPRWLRWLVLCWVVILLFRGCPSQSSNPSRETARSSRAAARPPLTPEQIQKAQAVAKNFSGAKGVGDLVRKLTKEFGDENTVKPILFLTGFTAPKDDAAATKLANGVFASLYGTLALEHSNSIALDKDSTAAPDPAAALERAKDQDAQYLLSGTVTGEGDGKTLTVTVKAVAKNEVYWTSAYPVSNAVATDIAQAISSHLPPLTSPP